MNKIEQMHLDAIENNICSESNYSKILGRQETASKSAEITQQISAEFAEWCANSHFHYYYNGDDWCWGNSHTQQYLSTKELFQEFLKTKQ